MAYVYKHIRLDKNQPFYIGIGSDSGYYRANKFSDRNDIWNKIKNKTNILVEIVEDNIEWIEACQIEITLIKKYGRLNNNTGILSNMTDGGEGTFNKVISEKTRFLLGVGNRGKKRSEESKLKQSKSTKGVKKSEQHRENIRKSRTGTKLNDDIKLRISETRKQKEIEPWNKGKTFTDESKEKMSKSKKGKKTFGDNPNSKMVLNIENGIFYDSLKEASISINMEYGMFKRKIKNKKIKFKYV